MGKALSEMTLEELWELFPIFLVEPSDQWESSYNKIETILKETLSECPVERISHIGSTAIHGIWAKDIVDVLVEITANSDMEMTAKKIEENGFIRMASSQPISFFKILLTPLYEFMEILTSSFVLSGKSTGHQKKSLKTKDFSKAADGNRTRDLHITNVTLYRLSHSSLVQPTLPPSAILP